MQGELIVNRIIKDGELKAEDILDKAKTLANQTLDKAREFTQNLKNQTIENLKGQTKLLRERSLTLSKIEGSKIILNKKQEILEEFKNKVFEDFLKQDKKDLTKFLEKLIKKYATKKDVLVLNIPNFKVSDIKSLKVVNDFNLTVKENKNKDEIGIILSNKDCDKNLTFKSLIADSFLSFEREVSEILFD